MADYLDRMLDRLPLQVAGIHIDCGGEFKANCEKKKLELFVLPRYLPKLIGAIERMQRTYVEEYHQCSAASRGARRPLLEYEVVCNTIRPIRLSTIAPGRNISIYEVWAHDTCNGSTEAVQVVADKALLGVESI
jgi:hypothetical protein